MQTKSRFAKPSIFDKASFLSRISISYVFPLFVRGIRNNGLSFKDMGQCPKQDEVEGNLKRLTRNWNQDKKKKNPKFWWTLARTFGSDFIVPTLCVMFQELILRILEPLCLGVIISHFSGSKEISYHQACYAAITICVSSMIYIWFYHPSLVFAARVGMRLRVVCTSIMYQKALRLSQASFGQTAVGQMVNIMSNDVNRLDEFSMYMPFLIVAPIQAIFVVIIVWHYLGVYCILMIVLLMAMLAIQLWMGQISSYIRKKTAPLTDNRLLLMHEIISGMRVIKMYCWEKPFAERISLARKNEMNQIRHSSYLKAANQSVYFVGTRIIVFASFVAYVLSGNTLTSEAVFVSLALFNTVRTSLTMSFQKGLNAASELVITCGRIQNFMLLNEFELSSTTTEIVQNGGKVNPMLDIKAPDAIPDRFSALNGKNSTRRGRTKPSRMIVNNICAKWSPDFVQATLKNISFKLEPGDLLAVIGPVGSGKSSFLMTLLGELPLISGDISLEGGLSYAGQESWSFNDTVRNNILFGLDYDLKRYQKVIEVCALTRDLKLMPFGDRTLVGEKGVSLSGGQKARMNLARAIYRNSEIYLLDDPLSAVDAAVAEHIFEKCILDYLKTKIRILVTHQIQFIQKATKILVLKDGQSVAFGSYDQLRHMGIDLMSLVTTETDEARTHQDQLTFPEKRIRNPSLLSSLDTSTFVETETTSKVVEETHQRGSIKGKVYWEYLSAGANLTLSIAVVVFTLLSQSILHGSDVFLSYWTNKNQLNDNNNDGTAQSQPDDINEQTNDILIYTGLIVALSIATAFRLLSIFIICIRASETLHNQIFGRLLRTTVSFFDSTPSGQILNRFTKDMGIVDEMLPVSIFDLNVRFIQVIGIVVIVCVINWHLILLSVVMLVSILYIRQFYIISARDIKRFEGIARSPIFSHLNTTINGLATIRAYGVQQRFEQQFNVYLDDHSSTWFMYVSTSRALGMMVNWVSCVYVCCVIWAVILFGELPGGTIGLAISSAMVLSQDAQWGTKQSAEFESQITSVERIVEYKNLQQEAPAQSSEEEKPNEEWPAKGAIQFDDMSLVYGDNDDKPVLRNLKCNIEGGEKIGIVGRTGAGKSSMIAALFRLTESKGVIRIDGVDIQSIGLDDLRQKISIIPQDPVIYSGTIRYNLDPFNQYSDEEIWSALDQVQLKASVNNFAGKLDAQLSESGGNLSVGQRQLICLARAILRRNRILVLDEATANIDHQTDNLIQETIRTQFVQCTVLTIAHRLNTIIDSDRVLVLDAGQIVEFDVPFVLLKRQKEFYDMCQKTGPKMYPHLLRVAKSAYENSLAKITVSL